LSCAKDFFEVIPPTSIISQSPVEGSLVVEFVHAHGVRPNELLYKHNDETSWLVVQRGMVKMIIAVGISNPAVLNDMAGQSNVAFSQLQNILTEEEMEFSDIIRQWNYIEQITTTVSHNDGNSQHYQIFNDVRSKYYRQASFNNGFPAATGIGMDFGGVIIDIIAAKLDKGWSVVALKSPVQLDAYSYTSEVLAENHVMKDFSRTTPKFERAKILITPEKKWIFISGTAAIVGQSSIQQPSAEHQTEMTIQNILRLISSESLLKHGVSPGEKSIVTYFRVYVKFSEDIQKVRETCLRYFPNVPMSFVVADICRPELLVEIEGLAVLQ